MPERLLTAVAVSKALSKEKAYKLSDGGGLVLDVPPQGSKRWRWRDRFDGKEKMVSLGVAGVKPALDRSRLAQQIS